MARSARRDRPNAHAVGESSKLVVLWDEHTRVVEARIASYSFFRDARLTTQHVFNCVLLDASGDATPLIMALQTVRRGYNHLDRHGAVARMVDTIARTPINDLAMLVKLRFSSK